MHFLVSVVCLPSHEKTSEATAQTGSSESPPVSSTERGIVDVENDRNASRAGRQSNNFDKATHP